MTVTRFNFPEPPNQVNLLDSLMADLNDFTYASDKNKLGKNGLACTPPTSDPEGRYTFGWTVTPISPISVHGTCPDDRFGTVGLPARPSGVPSGAYMHGIHFKNNDLAYHPKRIRLEHGLEIDTMRYWYNQGLKTWRFRQYLYVPTHTASSSIDQYLTIVSGAEADINLADINTSGGNVYYQILTSNGKILVGETLIGAYTVGGANFTELTFDLTIDATLATKLKRYGRDAWQLQIIYEQDGHFRAFYLYPTMTLLL